MIRADVVGALETALKKILKTNGYQSDLGKNVTIWSTLSHTDTTYPSVDIRDTKNEYSDRLGGGDYQTLTVEMTIVTKENSSIVQVRKYLDDLQKCMDAESAGIMYSYNLQEIRPEMDEILINEDFTKIAGGRLVLSVEYAGKRWGR